jgi:hypothetical protein
MVKRPANFIGASYFTGMEVECTAAYGMPTLFVVGVKATVEILTLAKVAEHKRQAVTHIYLGALGSLGDLAEFPKLANQIQQQIVDLLAEGYMVTLDIKFSRSRRLVPSWSVLSNEKFILMLSVTLPGLNGLGDNAVLKIDDTEFGGSNEGVYVVPLGRTLSAFFTRWEEYEADKVIC